MTRGRKPLVALGEAYGIAQKRGQVMEIASDRGDYFHFILFTGKIVTFIKIKRTLAKTSDPAGILREYQREIRHLSKVPLTPVSAREFWVRSPKGHWQFFHVGNDDVTEIAPDGQVPPGTGLPLEIPETQTIDPLLDRGTTLDQVPPEG
jgi:hypothetical protein